MCLIAITEVVIRSPLTPSDLPRSCKLKSLIGPAGLVKIEVNQMEIVTIQTDLTCLKNVPVCISGLQLSRDIVGPVWPDLLIFEKMKIHII